MPHPFDPLTPGEIHQAADIVRKAHSGSALTFRAITLLEPPKELMTACLDLEHAGTSPPGPPSRRATVQLFVDGVLHEVSVDLDTGTVLEDEALPGRHSYIDTAFMQKVGEACLADERIQKEIQSLKLPEGATIIVEPWAYATDGMNDMTERLTMAWFYMRVSDHPDANYYAYPLDICAEVSSSLEVTKIYRLPSGEHDRLRPAEAVPPEEKVFDRRKLQHHAASEYHPDLVPPGTRRTTTRPYRVSQPEGPSFRVEGSKIEWEKWTLRLSFNYREGMVLHDVRFASRSLAYRLSLAEMFVPYADPRCPYPRKAAFDLGNDGAGVNANDLRLGCDCLGHVRYFDGWLATAEGAPLRLPNAVCCHEADDGILWKHTSFRTGGAVVTRSRVLVLQSVVTVSNYEYVFCFYLQQDAGLFYEVRATGIMSTAPVGFGVGAAAAPPPYGTVVAPGVFAPYHQHLFCLRIDPAVDGWRNSVVVEESRAMPLVQVKGEEDEGGGEDGGGGEGVHNPFGVGFTTTSTTIEEEGGFDLDFRTNRVFKVVNEGVRNPITGTPVGIKLLPCYSQLLLAHPNSWHAKRSEYAQHAVWVTRYNDGELFPAGKFTMQSAGWEGIASWIKARREKRSGAAVREEEGVSRNSSSVRNEDIVVWHTFGSTHNPRTEDWPVMPCEKMAVGLKPINFFTVNPSLDVPISTQEMNCSVLVGDDVGTTKVS